MSGDSFQYEHWLDRSFGTQLVAWEERAIADALENVFGYYALQLGADHRSLLSQSRIPHRWLAQCDGLSSPAIPAQLVLDPHQLPFQANQLDLLVLPHTLERSNNPRQVVREAERVLLPEGRLVIAGLNPLNPKVAWQRLKDQRARRGEQTTGAKGVLRPLTAARLCDWLELLGFEIEYVYMGGGKRHAVLDLSAHIANTGGATTGKRYGRWWAKAYVVVATKKVAGMRLLMPPWQVKKLSKSLAVQKARHAGPVKKETK